MVGAHKTAPQIKAKEPMIILLVAFLFTMPLKAMMIEGEETPDVEMVDRPRMIRHNSPEEVSHFLLIYPNKVVNVIRVENLALFRTIQLTQNGILLDFMGVRSEDEREERIARTHAAIGFFIFTQRYNLLRRTPEQWLEEAGR